MGVALVRFFHVFPEIQASGLELHLRVYLRILLKRLQGISGSSTLNWPMIDQTLLVGSITNR